MLTVKFNVTASKEKENGKEKGRKEVFRSTMKSDTEAQAKAEAEEVRSHYARVASVHSRGL